MRTFLVVFLVTWLAGLTTGLLYTYTWYIVLLGGAVGVLLVFHRFTIQKTIACSLLFGLSLIYGYTVAAQRETVCIISSPFTGTVIERDKVGDSTVWYKVRTDEGCVARVSASRFPLYMIGDTLRIQGNVQTVAELSSELAGYATYLKNHGVSATVSFAAITLLTSRPSILVSLYTSIRSQILTLYPEPYAGFVLALLLGEKGVLPETLDINLRATGLSHIVAISGFHITMLAGIIFVVTSLIPVSSRVRGLITLSLIIVYVILVGAPPSAVRAVWFWCVFFVLRDLHRLVSLPSALLLTVVGMVSLRPQLLVDIGFTLSVAAISGIGLVLFLGKQLLLSSRPVVLIVAGVVLPSVGALLTTWPIILYTFGTFSATTIVANIMVEPVVPLMMLSSILTVPLSWGMPSVSGILSFIAVACIRWIETVSAVIVHAGGYWEHLTISGWLLVVYYGALVGLSHGIMRYTNRSWREMWE